jgi:putative nucleotidyltransferase with HDIG domain
VGASPRLIAHLILVHDTALRITEQIDKIWPSLKYDVKAVLIGAATHDIGKSIYKEELSLPGKRHEEIGPKLLTQSGLSESYARFARTHAQWQSSTVSIEDLLVALADKIWKGQRNADLEAVLTNFLAKQSNQEEWDVYLKLDDLINEITKDADARLNWQNQFSIV